MLQKMPYRSTNVVLCSGGGCPCTCNCVCGCGGCWYVANKAANEQAANYPGTYQSGFNTSWGPASQG